MKNFEIKAGQFVKFLEILEAGDEAWRGQVLDDFGPDSPRCLVQDLGTGLAIAPTRVLLKSELLVTC